MFSLLILRTVACNYKLMWNENYREKYTIAMHVGIETH